jgi:predicted nucleic acid-binding protein
METRKQKIYIDTSVIGGYYDKEFEKETRLLFKEIEQGFFEVVYSKVTDDELLSAPKHVRELMPSLPQHVITNVDLTEEAVNLANAYLSENVVGKTSRTDCYHIALATIHRVDILVSWNFKHIVNVARIRGYNAVNMKLGYASIDIRSPKEIIYSNED